MRSAVALALLLAPGGCRKVPIVGVNAGFTLADAAWFAEEQTLFVFWDVQAEQGIGDPSVIEVRWTTDDGEVDWTDIASLPMVHRHEPVDCGVDALCGSASLHVPRVPRNVDVRLRYHRDGELALQPDTVFNVVGPGPAHTHRSLIVYGVFDEANELVQWRGRHVFPTIRNEQASELGLRRSFEVRDTGWGTTAARSDTNPFGYGIVCPSSFVPTGFAPIGTDERAVFEPEPLAVAASGATSVCGLSTVTDALGTFSTGALARKNPQVRPAFPVLRSPMQDGRPLRFFLAPCERVISEEHEAMQRQRLLADGVPTLCADDWMDPQFTDELVVAFREAIEASRPLGDDMVLVIGLHQDQAGITAILENALLEVLPDERHRASPRVAGAFVFDSATHRIADPDIARSVLWCPASPLSTGNSLTCAAIPDVPGVQLGPLAFDALPILPGRTSYLSFIDDFSANQAGSVTSLTFRVPEFPTSSDHVDLGEFGVVTFLNGERIDAQADDAFSYCTPEEISPIVVRSEILQNPVVLQGVLLACAEGSLPAEICAVAGGGVIPVSLLPLWHQLAAEQSYQLGLFWDFPFLLQMEYRAVLAGSVGAFGLSVPFGLGTPVEQPFGTFIWTADEFPADALTQCDRFCDHPTFDSAGVYHVRDGFRETYANACYLPLYPKPDDGGFPLDP